MFELPPETLLVSPGGVLSTLHWSSNWTQHYTPEDEVISTNNKKYVIGQFLYSWGSNEKIKNQRLHLWHFILYPQHIHNEKMKYMCLYLWHLILYPQHIHDVNSNVNHISLQNQHNSNQILLNENIWSHFWRIFRYKTLFWGDE